MRWYFNRADSGHCFLPVIKVRPSRYQIVCSDHVRITNMELLYFIPFKRGKVTFLKGDVSHHSTKINSKPPTFIFHSLFRVFR